MPHGCFLDRETDRAEQLAILDANEKPKLELSYECAERLLDDAERRVIGEQAREDAVSGERTEYVADYKTYWDGMRQHLCQIYYAETLKRRLNRLCRV